MTVANATWFGRRRQAAHGADRVDVAVVEAEGIEVADHDEGLVRIIVLPALT